MFIFIFRVQFVFLKNFEFKIFITKELSLNIIIILSCYIKNVRDLSLVSSLTSFSLKKVMNGFFNDVDICKAEPNLAYCQKYSTPSKYLTHKYVC